MSAKHGTNEVVYVLDDDLSVLKSIGRLLVSEGFECRTFDDPASFLAAIQTSSVRVAVLDVWMEGLSGLEVQSKLRNLSPQTRVIVMTGRSDAGVRKTAIKMGASAFFTKPFGDLEFIGAVRDAFATKI